MPLQGLAGDGGDGEGTRRRTVCLCMIVKDEAPVVARCLASVRPIVDHWVVVDTGSSDGTQAIVREVLADLPGTLVERPWVDFAHNRSEALDLARPHGTYTLIIDADDSLRLPPGFVLPDLDADAYVLDIVDAGITYRRTQIVRSALPWRYRGVLHEFLTCEGTPTTGVLPMTMVREHDGARRRDPRTYRRDAEILERVLAIETDPFMVARYTFYLAQSYRDCGEREKALERYLVRAELGFWDHEVFVALLQAGRLMEALGRGPDAALDAYRRASAACPTRAEAAHAASRLYRLGDRFAEGCAVAAPALALTAPADGLFVEPWIYAYGLRDEYAVNAYWAGLHRACLAACLDLLACTDLPTPDRPRVAANARFALDQLAGRPPAVPEPALPTARSGWAPTRPQGGTELMVEGLRERLGAALDAVALGVNGEPAADGRPSVVWIHHDIDQMAMQWLDDPVKAERVDRFVFVSDWQRHRFVERFRLRPERCRVLRNATAICAAERPPRGDHPPRLAYASTPYRGLAVLLDAWELAWGRLEPHGAELHVWSSHKLYGPDSDDTPYAALYARAAALPGASYHGIAPNAELRRALEAIDIVAYPSTFAETSCLVAIEAMAAGCRVLCPDLGALPETTAGFARLYPHRPDPADHARAFADLLVDEVAPLWTATPAQVAAQRAYARAIYDWPMRVAEWRGLIAELTATTKPPPMHGCPAGPTDGAFDALARLRDRGFAPSGILDVGAHDGAFARGARRVFPSARILMVEALAEKAAILAEVCREIGGAGHAIALLGEHETPAEILFVVDTVARPDLVTTGASKYRENADFPMRERRMPQRRLGAVVAEHGGRFDLVKLDVQGAELDVLRGLGTALADVEVILAEMALVAYNAGAPFIDAVLVQMRSMGFCLYDIVDHHRYRDGGLLQVDGLFVRAGSALRPHPPFWS